MGLQDELDTRFTALEEELVETLRNITSQGFAEAASKSVGEATSQLLRFVTEPQDALLRMIRELMATSRDLAGRIDALEAMRAK